MITSDEIAALGSIATAILAALVYLEARSIRKTEWTFRQNQLWNEFNQLMAEHGDGCRIGAVLYGELVDIDPEDLSAKEQALIFSFMNVISSEYNALKAKLIVSDYVLDSFMDTARVVALNEHWILKFLESRGYEQSFIKILSILGDHYPDREAVRKRIKRELNKYLFMGLIPLSRED